MDRPVAKNCPNCQAPMAAADCYCASCGQKYTTGRVTLGELLRDAFDAVFNFDSAIFRTLAILFIPGKLTQEFFRGRHKSYVTPIRFFFVLAVVFLTVFSFDMDRQLQGDDLNTIGARWLRQGNQAILLQQLDSARREVLQEFDQGRRVSAAFDSLEKRLPGYDRDSFSLTFFKSYLPDSISSAQLAIAATDMVSMDFDSLLTAYGIVNRFHRLQLKQQRKLTLESKNFLRFLVGQLSWMILLMMPALALIFKLLYLRRDRYFVEHLVFTFHYHSFAFLLLSLAMPIGSFEQIIGWCSLIILIYLYIAMLRYYGQGWLKTLIKFGLLNFAYGFIFIIFILITIFISALTF